MTTPDPPREILRDDDFAVRRMPSQSSTQAALKELEAEGAARAVTMGWVAALAAGCACVFTLFLGGPPLLRWGMLAGSGTVALTGLWVAWRAAAGRYEPRVHRIFLTVSVVCSLPVQAYLGVFSAGPIAITVVLAFFAASDYRRTSLFGCIAIVLGYTAVAFPIAFGKIPDPGLLASSALSPPGRLFFFVMIPMIQGLTIWQSWRNHTTTRKAVFNLQDALDRVDEARKQAEASTRAKSEFLTNMSHEIRTPMNGILGLSELLLSRNDQPQEERALLTALHRSSSALLRLLDDILDLSRLEARRMSLQMGTFDLHEQLADLVGLFEPVATAKNVTLRAAADGAVPRWVVGDALRVRQILSNLVGNAIKFTAEGAVEVRLSVAESRPDEALRLRIEVEDSGIGIPAAERERVFEEFVQAESGVDRRYGGSGLGLAISQRLVRMMGGEIGLSSEERVGSLFWVELPLTPCEAPSEAEAEPSPAFAAPLPGGRLLVVEDDEINRIVLGSMLKALGYSCEIATSGREALAKLEGENPFLAVLMDCQMPELDGYATTRELRRRNQLEGLPIIGVSAHAFEEHRRQALDSGMNDYLTKPLNLADLEQALRRSLAAAE